MTNSLVGYLFMRTLAYHFGTSAQMSVFQIAFSVPFLVMAVSGFSFLHNIVATVFAKMRIKAPSEIDMVFSTTLNAMLIISVIFLVGCVIWRVTLAEILAPGLPAQDKSDLEMLLLLMLPLTIIFGFGTYFGGIFTAYQVPVTGEIVILASRLGVVAYALIAAQSLTLSQVALALLFFGLSGLLFDIVVLRQVTGLKYRYTLKLASPEFREITRKAAAFFLVALSANLSGAYMRSLATLAGQSTVATLSFGLSIVGPLGLVIGKTLNFSLVKDYVTLYQKENFKEAARLLMRYSLLILAITCLASVFLCLGMTHLITLLYGGGSFGAESVREVTDLTMPLIWSLPPSVLSWIFSAPILYQREKGIKLLVFLIGYLCQMLIYYLFFPSFGVWSLVWGYTCGVIIQTALGFCWVFLSLQKGHINSVKSI